MCSPHEGSLHISPTVAGLPRENPKQDLQVLQGINLNPENTNFTTKRALTILGTGLARTGTNTVLENLGYTEKKKQFCFCTPRRSNVPGREP